VRRALLAVALLGGCYAAPPPPSAAAELAGCRPGSYGTLSAHRCRRDADCVLCGAASGCGRVSSRRALERTNPPCPRPDAARCAGREARCCLGRCVLGLGPPAP